MNRDDASKFQVGDRVYDQFHGYGVVVEIKDDGREYPIIVTWDEKKHGCISIFTPEGFAIKGFNCDDTDLTLVEKASLKGEKEMEECINFKVGDRVFSSYHGLGTVIANHNDGRLYPIDVKWDKSPKGSEVSTFTKDGFLVVSHRDCGDNDKLTVVEKVIPAEEEKKVRVSSKDEEMAEGSNFQVGDRVRSREFGVGVVDEVIVSEHTYPITVKWTDGSLGGTYSSFTLEGHYYNHRSDAEKDITLLEGEGTVEEGKVKTDAINPPHYRVKGIPEAYDIMMHLMNREQLEGFLWGNIIKSAYRYGRKGDEAETAGKIKWYAQKLKELGECESE